MLLIVSNISPPTTPVSKFFGRDEYGQDSFKNNKQWGGDDM